MSERYRQLPIEELDDLIPESSVSREASTVGQEQQLKEQGILFDHIPEGIYPGMPYISVPRLVREGYTLYTRQYINKLARDGEILAFSVGEGWILGPGAVSELSSREEASMARPSFPGRKPGSKGREKS